MYFNVSRKHNTLLYVIFFRNTGLFKVNRCKGRFIVYVQLLQNVHRRPIVKQKKYVYLLFSNNEQIICFNFEIHVVYYLQYLLYYL